MVKRVFSRSELVERANLKKVALPADSPYALTDLLSAKWAKSFLTDLDTARDRVRKLVNAFSSAIHNLDSFGIVRNELACIPVSFTLKASTKISANAISRVPITIAENQEHLFEVGTEQCPTTIFPPNTELWHRKVKAGQPVWALYPPDIAKIANITPIKTWQMDDSIVDWLYAFIDLEDTEAAIRVDEDWDADNVIYNLYLPSKNRVQPTQDSFNTLPVEEQIYHFICQHAPVRRMKILTELKVHEKHVDRTLKQLEKDEQIEKVRHGVYVPTHTAKTQQ